MSTSVQVVFDAVDPHRLAAFWSEALDYELEDHSGVITGLLETGQLTPDAVMAVNGQQAFRDVAGCTDRDGIGPRLLFQRVPEAKTAKNRVHLDLQVGDRRAPAEVERLVALGATVAWTTSDRGPVTTTLRDPEGNEFCVT